MDILGRGSKGSVGAASRRVKGGRSASLNLSFVRSFQQVVDCGGFRLAAERLRLSQSTLSAHIAALEAQLGSQLLARTTRVVRLTPVGERFISRARRAIEELDEAASAVAEEASALSGKVVLACTPTLASNVVPLALKNFRKKHPGVNVEIIDAASNIVERLVLNGEADAGVGPPPNHGDLTFTSVGCEAFAALVCIDNDLGKEPRLELAHLSNHPIISMLPATSIWNTLELAFAKNDMPFRPSLTVRHHSTAIGLVDAGFGIAILPKSILAMVKSKRLRVIPVDPEIVRELGVMQRRSEKLGVTALALVSEVRRALQRYKADT